MSTTTESSRAPTDRSGRGSDLHEVRSPYSGELVGEVPWVGADAARSAVDVASGALARADFPIQERVAVLDHATALLRERQEQFAQLICAEAGKPIRTARVEVQRAVGTLEASATAARSLRGEIVPLSGPQGEGKLAFTLRVPVGVVAAITPFNFPLNLVAHKLAPAVAAGCPVVLKPTEKTPLTAIAFVELLRDAGMPAEWMTVVCGPAAEIAGVFTEDDRVSMITFTGSAPIGWQLREKAPRKKVSLELGNATPVIVDADADLEQAADKLASSAFVYSGQSCVSVQRIYVERRGLEPFLERVVQRASELRTGDPGDEQTDVGPLITADAHDRVLEWIQQARDAGATVHCGGASDGHSIVQPTVLSDVAHEMNVVSREAFGPLVSVIAYDRLEEALDAANATPYGLQAGIFTPSIDTAMRAARRLHFGAVMVNETPTFRADEMPYGGVKDSGNTKEGPAWTTREMTEERLVVIDDGRS